MLSIILRIGAVGLSGKAIPRPSFACLVTPRVFIFDQNFRYVVYCASCYVATSGLERQKYGICVQLILANSVPVRACMPAACVCACVSCGRKYTIIVTFCAELKNNEISRINYPVLFRIL
jgi:hypothetical protein